MFVIAILTYSLLAMLFCATGYLMVRTGVEIVRDIRNGNF